VREREGEREKKERESIERELEPQRDIRGERGEESGGEGGLSWEEGPPGLTRGQPELGDAGGKRERREEMVVGWWFRDDGGRDWGVRVVVVVVGRPAG